MLFELTILTLTVIITGLLVWIFTTKYYQKELFELKNENIQLKNQSSIDENLINSIKLEFSKIAQDSLKNQQEALLNEHSNDLVAKFNLFKAEEISPINKLLKEFKESIDNYQKSHLEETQDIKNAIQTAEKYAKALTSNQNTKGEFGEDWIEQIFKFVDLKENIHYTKQFQLGNTKPDFVVNLTNNKHIIIDSKVILKNYIEYIHSDNDENYKKAFINDISNCIVNLSKKNYEEIENLNQTGFILMYIPIESCINMIYTDYDFRKIIELANSRNIIIVGTSSLLVTLRLVNQLWANQTKYENIQNIITVGENLYNNITTHAQNLLNIQQSINLAASSINTEINRFTTKNNGSIFKEAEKLKIYGISAKEVKSGKKISEKNIPEQLLKNNEA